MSFNAFHENKILAKISEFTVHGCSVSTERRNRKSLAKLYSLLDCHFYLSMFYKHYTRALNNVISFFHMIVQVCKKKTNKQKPNKYDQEMRGS